MTSIIIYDGPDIRSEVKYRSGEHKLGENIVLLRPGGALDDLSAYVRNGVKYALLGIPESIGPRANHGKRGAERAWKVFVKSFLNMQSNRFLYGENMVCLGHVNTEPLNEAADRLKSGEPEYYTALRELCSRLDALVAPIIETIVAAGLVPIVVSGGHNNAYPIMKGTASALKASKVMQCINCDPHADFRALEGRHSGNGFSYAYEEGYLRRYFVFGLHESYNSEAVMARIDRNPNIGYCSFDLLESFSVRLEKAIDFLSQSHLPVGIEVDMDAISDMPASAVTPCGFGVLEVRKFVRKITERFETSYLHLAEGAPTVNTYDEVKVGKTLAYLVADFIKSKERKK
jgi:formiminoglutamase